MTDKISVNGSRRRASKSPRWARYAFWGGTSGFLGAIAALFVVTVYYGETLGMGTASCLIFGCAMTTILSQPVGLSGMALGLVIGALCGTMAHHATK